MDNIDFKALLPEKTKYNISIDDVIITPNVFGKNHQFMSDPRPKGKLEMMGLQYSHTLQKNCFVCAAL